MRGTGKPVVLTTQARLAPRGPGGAWTFITLRAAESKRLGARGRVPVVLTVGGRHFAKSLFPTGDGRHEMMFNRQMQAAAGAKPGDTVTVRIMVDVRARSVRLPVELRDALAHSPAATSFRALAYSHQKAWVDWIVQAKRPETRRRRVETTIFEVARGRGRSRS